MLAPAPARGEAPVKQGRPYRAWIFLLLFYLVLTSLFTAVPIGGDTLVYADDIKVTLGHGWTDSDPIWNFSHILWRPLGRILYQAFGGFVAGWFGGDVITTIVWCLVAMNFIAAPAAALGLHAILWRLTGREWMPALLCAAFLCLTPLLNYSRFATPHLCGVACSIWAIYFAAFCARPSRRTAAAAGLLAGLAM